MIVETMTSTEMYKEIMRDYDDVCRYIEANTAKYIRAARKSNIYPKKFDTPIKYKSKHNNQFYAFVECRNKKMAKNRELLFTIIATFNHRNATAIIMIPMRSHLFEKHSIIIYTSHLFKRYRERFLGDYSISNWELISCYVKNNPQSLCYPNPSERYGENAIASTINQGILFGVREENATIFKTFLNKEKLYANQLSLDRTIEFNAFLKNIA